jgi:hypothetical protein
MTSSAAQADARERSMMLEPFGERKVGGLPGKFMSSRYHQESPCQFLSTDEGAVTWQEKYVTRSAKRIKIY